MLDTSHQLLPTDFPALSRKNVETLQLNLGYTCNLSCTHCHVNAGPKRTEQASIETINAVLAFIDKQKISVLDLTGGAPEINPHFRYIVTEARSRGISVIDRCNLTILDEPGYEDLADFLAESGVIITASLPCYQEENVSAQRGKGVFTRSIEALQKLNALGYGRSPELRIDLVYNPNGAFLPPDQQSLEADYKKALYENYGIEFNQLLTLTNMPISRFGSTLQSKGNFEEYLCLLRNNFSKSNLENLMCLSMVSVDWQGYVYDCDFNQMLNWPMKAAFSENDESNKPTGHIIGSDKKHLHILELVNASLKNNAIVVGEHCYGCTAGQGSSCGGALS